MVNIGIHKPLAITVWCTSGVCRQDRFLAFIINQNNTAILTSR